ncbi:unnamed protein product [Moneuplotes crassus]|uniref:Uncharacterized protein n=1 Tax=Euplotes crassus TaxID=5936 RepID=A0AAD1XNB4_EUPCR|nr:unnamed protein product [Moneuplotes crassus]
MREPSKTGISHYNYKYQPKRNKGIAKCSFTLVKRGSLNSLNIKKQENEDIMKDQSFSSDKFTIVQDNQVREYDESECDVTVDETIGNKFSRILNTNREEDNKRIMSLISKFDEKKPNYESMICTTPKKIDREDVATEQSAKTKFKYFAGINRNKSNKDSGELTDKDKHQKLSECNKIQDKNLTLEEILNLSERKDNYSGERFQNIIKIAKNDPMFDLNSEQKPSNILRKMVHKIESYQGGGAETDVLVDELQDMIKNYKNSNPHSLVNEFENKKAQVKKSSEAKAARIEFKKVDYHKSIGSMGRKNKLAGCHISEGIKASQYYKPKRVLFTLAKDCKTRARFKKSKPRRVVRFDCEEEKRLDDKEKSKRNIFVRSKSLDRKSIGSVPAIVVEVKSVDKVQPPKQPEKRLHKNNLSENKEPPKAAVCDLSLSNKKQGCMKWKKIKANQRRESRFTRSIGGAETISLKEPLSSRDNRKTNFIRMGGESSTSDDENLSFSKTNFKSDTKRRKFLNRCYQVEARHLYRLEKSMNRSEKKSPNRELVSLYKAIQRVNKVDLYETVIKEKIMESRWDKFLNEAYTNPFRFGK